MKLLNFQSENLVVDWISFNLEGLMDPRIIGNRLSKYFTPQVLIDDVPKIGYHGLKKKHKVSVRQYTGSKGHWVGTRIIFSGKDAAYCYNLIKTQKFDWKILRVDQHNLSLGRIDLCFSRPNDLNNTSKSFDVFLVDSRTQIQTHTTTRHIKLEDFPSGKMLKVNRRNNSVHYRVYRKDQSVRFELELKHRQTKLVQDYLFNNQLDIFEQQLVLQYFKYSGRVLCLNYVYSDWIVDFQRRQQRNLTSRSLVTSYLETVMGNEKEEERLFHLFQFLSFVKSLELNIFKDCKKHRIKDQFYYGLKFPLSQFVKFTGIHISKQSQRDKLIRYFKQLQKLDPIVKEFSDRAFRSYVCFPYVGCENPSGNSWSIEVFAAEVLFCFPYPFQLPKSFLISTGKNDLRLKLRLMKSLAVHEKAKRLDLEKFFDRVHVPNNQLIEIKKSIIQLLNELVENKIIHNEVGIILKSGKKKDRLIKNLTTSDITRRIKHIKFHEKI
nr:hypothetical protein [Haslea ostrearia]